MEADPDTIDLSSASEDELLELSGVGPALARRIVAWREEHGGFESVDQLSEVRGISPRVLEELRPHVRADPFTYITVDAIRDPDLALSESLRSMGDGAPRPDPARRVAAEPRSRVSRLRAFATENVGNVLLIALIAVVELVIVVLLVRAL